MMENLIRTESLLGKQAMEKLSKAKVLIAGLGGVGGYCLEALARSGVNKFVLIDADKFEQSNLNRQMLCLYSDIGMLKVDKAEERVHLINPNAEIEKHAIFLNSENIDGFLDGIDLVVDAIDSVESKCCLLNKCIEKKIDVVSSMGAALRVDPTLVRTADISKTTCDPLAKAVRKNVSSGVECVYSLEKPMPYNGEFLGSIATVTGTFGLVLAQLAINKIIK